MAALPQPQAIIWGKPETLIHTDKLRVIRIPVGKRPCLERFPVAPFVANANRGAFIVIMEEPSFLHVMPCGVQPVIRVAGHACAVPLGLLLHLHATAGFRPAATEVGRIDITDCPAFTLAFDDQSTGGVPARDFQDRPIPELFPYEFLSHTEQSIRPIAMQPVAGRPFRQSVWLRRAACSACRRAGDWSVMSGQSQLTSSPS